MTKYKLESIPVRVRLILKGEQNSLYLIHKKNESIETRELIARDCNLIWFDVSAYATLEKVEYEETMFPETTRIKLGIEPYIERG